MQVGHVKCDSYTESFKQTSFDSGSAIKRNMAYNEGYSKQKVAFLSEDTEQDLQDFAKLQQNHI